MRPPVRIHGPAGSVREIPECPEKTKGGAPPTRDPARRGRTERAAPCQGIHGLAVTVRRNPDAGIPGFRRPPGHGLVRLSRLEMDGSSAYGRHRKPTLPSMADKDTDIAGSPEFPSTVWGRLVQGADPREAAEYLAERYWKPAYLFIRRRWRRTNEDAKDLTQGFFADVLSKGLLGKADPNRGSFRHFLRTSLENYLRNSSRDAKALKRGGGVKLVPIELLDETEMVATDDGTPEEQFNRDWLQAVFDRCLPRLREQYVAEGRPACYEIFRRYDLDPDPARRPTYEELARDLNLKVTEVRNWLAHARGRWQKLIREALRETSSSPADLEREVRELLGR